MEQADKLGRSVKRQGDSVWIDFAPALVGLLMVTQLDSVQSQESRPFESCPSSWRYFLCILYCIFISYIVISELITHRATLCCPCTQWSLARQPWKIAVASQASILFQCRSNACKWTSANSGNSVKSVNWWKTRCQTATIKDGPWQKTSV